MPTFVKYIVNNYNREDFSENLNRIKDTGFDGVIISSTKSMSLPDSANWRSDFLPISRMIDIARGKGLKTGVILVFFHSPLLWKQESFSPPVGISGAAYVPDDWYHPVCPNNPTGLEYFYRLIDKMARVSAPDYFYLEHLRFPFFWEKEELDIQNRVPPFCYCPFCVTEFSSVVGEIITSPQQIVEMMPEWLQWRSTTIFNMIADAKQTLGKNSKLIISLPPLALIDLPFTTGQLPLAIADEGCFISPYLHHKQKQKNLMWAEDLLDQYRLEIKMKKIFPCFEASTRKELDKYISWARENVFPGVIFHEWFKLRNNL
ncbi:MAG: hypothetical protein COT43_07475 [Candidatus Marinimicrobia bacterium CG08_land_8_20_14_0_20_45_22]|nr:MAG: hypothetical protein COT43_07475 [Candidatus Marinimicrobia bacterium CG08_land_8_20_14_0_20_45_22]